MDITQKKKGVVVTHSTYIEKLGNQESQYLCDIVKEQISKKIFNLVLDLKSIKSINSIGIGIILSCWTSLSRTGGKLKLARVSGKVLNMLKLTEVDSVIEIYDNLENAVDSF